MMGRDDKEKALIHSFIHSKILIVLLSCARLWEVLGITIIKADGALGRICQKKDMTIVQGRTFILGMLKPGFCSTF